MTRIELKTSDQVLSVVKSPTIASGDQNTVGIKVHFDGAWDGYDKTATFSTATAPDVYEIILDDDACVIPFEVLTTPGTLYIGIRGIKANDGKVKTSTLVSYRIKEGAPIGTATAKPPTPDVYQQLLEKLAQIEDDPGKDGASAYEIWLAAGNTGTEADFLESLNGEDGKDGADGKDGVDGKNGADGKDGKDGNDYILTETDKTEIAEEAAGKLQPEIDELSEAIVNKSDGIIETATGEALALSDSAEAPLRGLTVYGKSTQDGTPTPDAPIDIVSVGGDGVTDVYMYRSNLFDVSAYTSYKSNGVTFTNNGDGSLAANGTNNLGEVLNHATTVKIAVNPGTYIISGASSGGVRIVSAYKNDKNINQYKYGDGAFTVGKRGNIVLYWQIDNGATVDATIKPMLNVGSTALPWEPYAAPQTCPISTPNGLCGIPVTSGGNYTDANGQQWICDEVDFGRGVYVQRVRKHTYTGASGEGWTLQSSTQPVYKENKIVVDNILPKYNSVAGVVISDTYKTVKHDDMYKNETENALSMSSTGKGVFVKASTFTGSTAGEFNVWLSEHPFTVMYALETPIETPLTGEELAAYRAAAMHTNYPNTTIYADDNAGLSVDYKADTKLYIDKKFAELAAAIVNN